MILDWEPLLSRGFDGVASTLKFGKARKLLLDATDEKEKNSALT
jgi:hypothetical protein